MKKIRSKHNNDTVCNFCGFPFSKHPHCKRCKISLHESRKKFECETCGVQHTLISKKDKNYCEDCFINYIKKHQ